MPNVYPVLLAGGSGTRLWPLSRKTYPKQFSNLVGKNSLFQGSAERLTSSETLEFEQIITLTNSDFRFIIEEQFKAVDIHPGPILIEPETKNTAAAILAASLFAKSKDENAVLIVAPSDHIIPDKGDFHKTIIDGLLHVESGKIVTFGIKPTHPETAYGYLHVFSDKNNPMKTSVVREFVEKPNAERAKQMLNSGDYLWNAGIFLFRAKDMIDAFHDFAPVTLDLVSRSVNNLSLDLGFLRLAPEPWSLLPDISIDYAIMEKSQNLVVVPYTSRWSDLGAWDTVWAEGDQDVDGNVLSDAAYSIGCSDSLLRSEDQRQKIVGIGLDNIVAIAMPDAVLVAKKDHAQEVKRAVELLKEKNVEQAEIFPKDYRPWGWFESLVLGDCFQVKRIYVHPGASLSLQSHKYRSEHWIVVEGTAKVTIDNEIKLVTAGQSVYVPLGAMHRMENPGTIPMLIIEVQIGSYLGEDDIIRHEDMYARK